MKKSKGFTLIELLAIIVILAIIAVITVPLILNIIDDSKKGTIKDSVYGYKDAIDKYYVSELYKNNNSNLKLNGVYSITDKGELSDGENTYKIPFSGTAPTGGNLTYENNILKNGCITMNEYKATIENGEVTNVEKGSCESIKEEPTSEFVYFEVEDRPTTESTTDYTNLWSHMFFGLTKDDEVGVCIYDEKLYCVKPNETEKSFETLKSYLGEEKCTIYEDYTSCINGGDKFYLYSNGRVMFWDDIGAYSYQILSDGKVVYSSM